MDPIGLDVMTLDVLSNNYDQEKKPDLLYWNFLDTMSYFMKVKKKVQVRQKSMTKSLRKKNDQLVI